MVNGTVKLKTYVNKMSTRVNSVRDEEDGGRPYNDDRLQSVFSAQ